MRKKILNSLFFSIILTLGLNAQYIKDSILITRFYDIYENPYLEIIREKGLVSEINYYQSDTIIKKVNLLFDSSNKQIHNLNDLYKYIQTKYNSIDSSLLITCILYNKNGEFSDYRVIFCFDNACVAAFRRDMIISKKRRKDLKKNFLFNGRAPYSLLIKDWRCKTTPTFSIFN